MKGYIYARMWYSFVKGDDSIINTYEMRPAGRTFGRVPTLYSEITEPATEPIKEPELELLIKDEKEPVDCYFSYLVCIGQTTVGLESRYKDQKGPPPYREWIATVSDVRLHEDKLRSSFKMFLSNRSLYAATDTYSGFTTYGTSIGLYLDGVGETENDYTYPKGSYEPVKGTSPEFKSKLRKIPHLFKKAEQLSVDRFQIPYTRFRTNDQGTTLLRPVQEIIICTFFDAYFNAITACFKNDHKQMSIIE